MSPRMARQIAAIDREGDGVRRDPFPRGKPDNPETGTNRRHEIIAIRRGRQDEPGESLIDPHLDIGYGSGGANRPVVVDVDPTSAVVCQPRWV